MNTTIWKFPLGIALLQTVRMPKGANILCVQMQDNVPTLWAEVDPQAEEEYKSITMVGTGHSLPDGLVYIGTVQQFHEGTTYVWHIYRDRGLLEGILGH